MVSEKSFQLMVEEVSTECSAMFGTVKDLAESYPWFRDHAKRMIKFWSTGTSRLNGEKIALAQNVLDQVGFSNELKKTAAPEKMIAENSLASKKFRP